MVVAMTKPDAERSGKTERLGQVLQRVVGASTLQTNRKAGAAGESQMPARCPSPINGATVPQERGGPSGALETARAGLQTVEGGFGKPACSRVRKTLVRPPTCRPGQAGRNREHQRPAAVPAGRHDIPSAICRAVRDGRPWRSNWL